MPELQRRYGALARAGVDLLGISVDLETVENVPAYVAKRGVTYPIYTTEESTLDLLYPAGEATVPLTLLLDDRGTLLEIYPGWSARTEHALDALARGAAAR
jgi:peroxiredoxin